MDEEIEGKMEKKEEGEVKDGVASIALLPCGSNSGHFIHMPLSICYGTVQPRGGLSVRLIKLTIIDFTGKKEHTVVVECKGHDAARINEKKVSVSFECEILKADNAAEDDIRPFMPRLSGLDAVTNIGPMKISGIDFAAVVDEHAN